MPVFVISYLQRVGTVQGVCWVIASVRGCVALPLTIRLLIGAHRV